MRVHLVGVSGTGMGALAALFIEAGHEVRGSDVAFDPPAVAPRWALVDLVFAAPAASLSSPHVAAAPEGAGDLNPWAALPIPWRSGDLGSVARQV